jgi:1-acyl-sn-glycerol-3-phosphate acyltransferase
VYGLKREIHGVMPQDGKPLIIAPTHRSGLDMYVIGELVNGFPTTAVAKELLFYVPKLGTALRSMHAVKVKRNKKNTKHDIQSLNQVADFSQSEGYHILIFPEGTRSKNTYFGEFKWGAFNMAYQTKRDILPIYIDYGINTGNTGYYGLKPGVIQVWIGEPIPAGDHSPYELRRIYERAMYGLKLRFNQGR